MTIWAIKGTIILQKPVNKDNQSHVADCKDSSIRPKEQKKSKIIIDSTGKKLNRSGWSVMINPEAVGMDKNSKRKSSKSTTKGHTKLVLQSNRQTRGEKQQIKFAKFRAADSVRLTSSTQYQYQYESGYICTTFIWWCSRCRKWRLVLHQQPLCIPIRIQCTRRISNHQYTHCSIRRWLPRSDQYCIPLWST